jgi:alpha-soluble NSF attachment protein
MSVMGDEHMRKADGKVNAFLFKDYEGAYDLYIKAAGCYKADMQWNQAGDAFMKAGDLAMKLKNPGDAQSAYADCAKMLKKTDIKKAKAAMEQAIKLNIENNRLTGAAKLLKDWAEALEFDEQYDEALAAYKKAHDYYSAEDQAQTALGCLNKMATILATINRFDEASKTYETLGFRQNDGPLRMQAKEQFFRAFLCRLATITADNRMEASSEARDALDTYINTCTYLRNTREAENMELLLAAVEDENEEQFDEAIGNMNELRMLDDGKSHILLKIKQELSNTR